MGVRPVTSVAGAGLAAAWQTDAGRVRGNNEDLPMCDPGAGIFGVIDGVGGHAAGEVAADIARREILRRLSRPLGSSAERAREAIALANNAIWQSAEERAEYEGMTCVLTLAIVADHRITIGHVGDSRCYKLTPSGIRKLTRDHSPVGVREDASELTELEAMRHPRRHEVFRDVGSVHHDTDDDGFVDVIEDVIEADSAILLCTDGLTDMVPSATIEQVVRMHAGDPQAVVDALVASANEAGGKDNVTVVYAEAPDFATALRRVNESSAADTVPQTRRRTGSGALWFACGALGGVGAALALAAFGAGASVGGRTLVVGADAPFARIDAAITAAHRGDVIELKPGVYAESVVLPDGVDLVAAIPGSATLVRDETEPGEWRAIAAAGSGRIAGLKIESRAAAPIAIGIAASSGDRRIENCELDGPMTRAGIELADTRGAIVSESTLRVSDGPAIAVVGGADVNLQHNSFVRPSGSLEPALSFKDTQRPTLRRNLFAGYGTELVRGLSQSERDSIFAASRNLVVAAPPAVAR
jgi:serine/threonine protein phosphatase PrpC